VINLVKLGAAILDKLTGALLIQAKGGPVSETDDNAAPDYGNAPNFSALGLTAMPYPETEDGHAEGIVVEVPGLDGAIIGGRDTRTAKIVGNLKPGDTVVHSTGPEQAAQLQLKEKKRQAVLRTIGTNGKDVAIVLDGRNDKVQVIAFGQMFEMTPSGVSIVEKGGAAILMGGGVVRLLGTVVLGGSTPIAPVHSGFGPSAPSPGVFVGI